MTPEEKQLLLKDLCARLPYGVRIKRETITGSYARVEFTLSLETFNHLKIGIQEDRYSIKSYLRPMSSMTEEERMKIASMAGFGNLTKCAQIIECCTPIIDYCYSRYLDIHNLIEKDLALEAPDGLYKTE